MCRYTGPTLVGRERSLLGRPDHVWCPAERWSVERWCGSGVSISLWRRHNLNVIWGRGPLLCESCLVPSGPVPASRILWARCLLESGVTVPVCGTRLGPRGLGVPTQRGWTRRDPWSSETNLPRPDYEDRPPPNPSRLAARDEDLWTLAYTPVGRTDPDPRKDEGGEGRAEPQYKNPTPGSTKFLALPILSLFVHEKEKIRLRSQGDPTVVVVRLRDRWGLHRSLNRGLGVLRHFRSTNRRGDGDRPPTTHGKSPVSSQRLGTALRGGAPDRRLGSTTL